MESEPQRLHVEELIGRGVAMEPVQAMSCLLDCPLSREGGGEPACDKGPLMYGEVSGVIKHPEKPASLLLNRLGYVCTRGGSTRFFGEADLRPQPGD
ncbi:MAG TPA: hypothetical protein VLF62_00260 [Candidatus Saccharimonadales bacterium]|nr:hypothetical protein [Candidatus Saccharimonadales bacterium]